MESQLDCSTFDDFGLPAIDYILNFKDQHTPEEINRLILLTSHLVDLSRFLSFTLKMASVWVFPVNWNL